MERKEERPDTRYWTSYDYFQVEREVRALRRKELRALMRALARKVRDRVALSLKHAGAQPMAAKTKAA